MARSIDMTSGHPLPLLWKFTLPTLVGNLLHQAYSITDTIVVGRYLGHTALAAVGCTAPVIMLLAALMVGINMGVGILISQHFGSRDYDGIRSAFINSLYLGLIIAAVLAISGLLLAEPILRLMGTPDGPMQDAVAYLRINFMTTVCPLFYYLFSSVFRGIGDSRTALYCLVVSAVGNIALDILFVAVFHWGVEGTAWATALAQALSALFAFILLYRRYPHIRLCRTDFAFNIMLFCKITRLALPIALQSAFNNFSNLIVQSGINTFGETVMAAYTAASRIGTLALMPVETVASSLSLFVGQNHGAHQSERIRNGVRSALVLALIISALLAVGLLLGGDSLSKLFLPTPSPEILAVVQRYLLITTVPGFLAGIMHIYQQALRGIGRPNQALAGGLLQLLIKISIVAIGVWSLHILDVVWLSWPLSFIAGSIIPIICFHHYLRESAGKH
ncbi:MAG: MATE family efflux transporter [Clostridiales bacterium]|nr:MATE family efflux transporter [Clostridiales bacterium]